MNEPQIMPTVGAIARRLGVSHHRLRYVIDALGIEPAGRAGIARVFSEADIERIGCELERIAQNANARKGSVSNGR